MTWTCSDCGQSRDSFRFAAIHAHSAGHCMVLDADDAVFVN